MNLKIRTLKKLDAVLGRIACRTAKFIVKPRPLHPHSGESSASVINRIFPGPKILVIRPGGIGDATLLIPSLVALREEFPSATLDVLAEKRNASILKECPVVDEVLLYDNNPPATIFGVIKRGYDVTIDTEQWHHFSALVAYLTRAPIRIGFSTNERRDMFTNPVPYSHKDYEALSFLNLVSAITGRDYVFDPNSPFIKINPVKNADTLSAIDRLRKQSSFVVGVFPGATVPERRWGKDNYTSLIKGLQNESISVVIVGGEMEERDASAIEKNVGGSRVLNIVGKTSLSGTMAVIDSLDLFITSDSGLLHIACGLGTPTLSLFGAGIEDKWGPRGVKHSIINKRLHCSPCTQFGYTPACPYKVECLNSISSEEVMDRAVKRLHANR